MGRMPDHMNENPKKPVNKLFPAPWLTLQAAIKNPTIDFDERHEQIP
jgi:hypothetical protein